jgi:N-hydroxyarylamine O-acetyltransferase
VYQCASCDEQVTLARVQLAHVESIPFENLDVVLRKPIDMSIAAVYRKLVTQQRGGYCFEHNTLLMEALRCLGFVVKPALARVRWNRPSSVDTAFTHEVLIVNLPEDNSSFLVDGGFGGLQCLVPLPLARDALPTSTPDGDYCIAECGPDHHDDGGRGYLVVRWRLLGEWVNMYKFRNEVALDCDLAVANHWMATAPGSRWTGCLFAARIIAGARHHVLNDELCIRGSDGRAKRSKLGDAAAVLRHLRDSFGIALPESLTDFATGSDSSLLQSRIALVEVPSPVALVESFVQRGASFETFHAAAFTSGGDGGSSS